MEALGPRPQGFFLGRIGVDPPLRGVVARGAMVADRGVIFDGRPLRFRSASDFKADSEMALTLASLEPTSFSIFFLANSGWARSAFTEDGSSRL